ncbi:MAG TPA: hypothetical protein VMU39_17525 [Solirubrobacteraceae bacterium]|nr:hypothetical protein [Solirubrobacteraceae bacterium]
MDSRERRASLMRRARVVLACVSAAIAVLAGAATSVAGRRAPGSDSPAGVRLLLAHPAYRAGQSIPVTLVNGSRSLILRGVCFDVQRRADGGWMSVTGTHGIALPCSMTAGVPQPAGARADVELVLYDDLRPGDYRITLRYKPAHGVDLGNLTGPDVRSVHAGLSVLVFRLGAKPSLSGRRILALAERAASGAGDPQPTLIQHAAGTRFDANRIASGELVFEWNWSYLIAIRGHFAATRAPLPHGGKPPSGTVITLVVDARTGQITDGGLSNRYPSLAQLGPVTTDLRGAWANTRRVRHSPAPPRP